MAGNLSFTYLRFLWTETSDYQIPKTGERGKDLGLAQTVYGFIELNIDTGVVPTPLACLIAME